MALHIPSNLTKYRDIIVLIEGLFVDYTKTWRLLQACVMFRHYRFLNNGNQIEREIEYEGKVYTEHGYTGTDKPDVKVLIPIFERIEVDMIAYHLESLLASSRIKKLEDKNKYIKLIFHNQVTINVYKHQLLAISTLYNSLHDENYKVTQIEIPIVCLPEVVSLITSIIQEHRIPYCDNNLVRNENMVRFADILNYLGIGFL